MFEYHSCTQHVCHALVCVFLHYMLFFFTTSLALILRDIFQFNKQHCVDLSNVKMSENNNVCLWISARSKHEQFTSKRIISWGMWSRNSKVAKKTLPFVIGCVFSLNLLHQRKSLEKYGLNALHSHKFICNTRNIRQFLFYHVPF